MHFSRTLSVITACALSTFNLTATAQFGYPNKPIKMIIPLADGSAVGNAVRILIAKMSQGLGQNIVIENQAGTAGTAGLIGADRVVQFNLYKKLIADSGIKAE